MNNLSMNSSYSSAMAMLYGASPTNSVVHRESQVCDDLDLGKTPKKNNTSSKKKARSTYGATATNMDEAVFRLGSMTPRFRSASDTDDESSPALLDLIGGAETPTTGLLMSSIENAMMDDIHSLNRNLRGHAFTPLPHIMGGGGGADAALMGSGGDASGLSITPQLSWSTNNGSPLEITPRCFGLLDSTKSMNKNPLGSPKSFWKENTSSSSDEKKNKKDGDSGEKPSILSLLSPTMREMEISQDMSMDGSRSTTPLPLNYGKKDHMGENEAKKKEQVKSTEFNQKTPVHKPPAHGGHMMGGQHQPPPMHPMQASPWAQLGGYMPSPIPGAFPSMSPGFGLYPQMEPNPNDRVRNLRGRGPPVHAIPPSHRLPPPTYHHFSPLTNVMKRPVRAMSYHPAHSNVPPQVDVSSASKSNCVPMKPPIPSKFQGDMNKYKDAAVPDFNNLVNFPCHMNQKSAPAPDGTRNCVMCGHSCPCTTGVKQKGKNNNSSSSSSHPLADYNQNKGAASSSSGLNNNFAIIPSQNKGLCTLCDVNVWIVLHSGLEIKWCKGCKNFRPWAAFGEKGLATKCVRCRERQREKYAMEKEKKERAKSSKPSAANSSSSGRVMATSN
jgi:Zn-finger nucleic acid-binding protein